MTDSLQGFFAELDSSDGEHFDLKNALSRACASRIERIRSSLHESGLDACYIRDLSNIKWASAFEGVFDDEPAHALLITPTRAILHSDSRYATALEQAALDTPIEISLAQGSHAKFLHDVLAADLEENRSEETAKEACAVGERTSEAQVMNDTKSALRVAIEDTLTLREFSALEETLAGLFDLVVTENFIEHLREVKDDLEVALMRRAQAITDEAFTYICEFVRPGMSELTVQRELDAKMFALGASGLAFPTIVATGEHAASPHAIPDERSIRVGDAVVMDFGARFAGYCSDMTRTIFIGEPEDEMKKAWSAVREANETCEEALRAGKSGAEIHKLAEDVLAAHGFAGRMGHGLGHSLGIDIHENPSLSLRNEDSLPAGAVLTVEPGIYIPDRFGMRLEDFGLVTEEGFDIFTQSTHDMVIIDPLKRS